MIMGRFWIEISFWQNHLKQRFCGFGEVRHHSFGYKNGKITENIDFAVFERYDFMVSTPKMAKSSKLSILRFWGGTTSCFAFLSSIQDRSVN